MPIKNISDANMIRIMANENIEEWKTSPSVIHETIKVAKTFLNSELAKYKTWDELQIPDVLTTSGRFDYN